MSSDKLICIYDETKENIENIIFEIYKRFVDNELEQEFKV